MPVIGVDLGGTKLALALFSDEGEVLRREVAPLQGRQGAAVGALLAERTLALLDTAAGGGVEVGGVGVIVPGIYSAGSGRVWAPNIPGWGDYPLRRELQGRLGDGVVVTLDSDRAGYILGEVWQGVARGARNAIFVAVGTGIGAGILIEGQVLRGTRDIAGATGWLALDRPYRPEYRNWGCFEHHASGPGLVRVAREYLAGTPGHRGPLAQKPADQLTTADVFAAEEQGDELARRVFQNAVEFWGMAVANYVSLFDPEIVVLGGGVFGPAARFLERIRMEALKWAQPITMPQVRLEVSVLGTSAGLYGAGYLALLSIQDSGFGIQGESAASEPQRLPEAGSW